MYPGSCRQKSHLTEDLLGGSQVTGSLRSKGMGKMPSCFPASSVGSRAPWGGGGGGGMECGGDRGMEMHGSICAIYHVTTEDQTE